MAVHTYCHVSSDNHESCTVLVSNILTHIETEIYVRSKDYYVEAPLILEVLRIRYIPLW